jgi:hypothetical protein
MSNVVCNFGSTSLGAQLTTRRNVEIGTVQRPFSNPNLEWFTRKFGENLRINVAYELCSKAISSGRFDQAIEIIQTDIFKRSEVLAKTFDKEFKGKAYISDLIEELRQEGCMAEEDVRRLFVIMMAIDGLEMEVREYGGRIEQDDLEYFLEFARITENMMKKKDTYMGMSLPSFEKLVYSTGYTEAMTIRTVKYLTNVDEFCPNVWDSTNINVSRAATDTNAWSTVGAFTDFPSTE